MNGLDLECDLITRHFVQFSYELSFEYQHFGPIWGWLLRIRTKLAQISHNSDHSVGYSNGSTIWKWNKCLFYVQMAFGFHCAWIAINLRTVFGSSLVAVVVVVVVVVDADVVSGGPNDGARTGTSAQQERIQRSYCHWNKIFIWWIGDIYRQSLIRHQLINHKSR